MKMLEENQEFTCTNKKCKRSFSEPILVHDVSSKTEYYGCPSCFTEFIKRLSLNQKGKRKKEISKAQVSQTETHLQETDLIHQVSQESGCSYGFGHLRERSKEEEIPEECMLCRRLVECMRTN